MFSDFNKVDHGTFNIWLMVSATAVAYSLLLIFMLQRTEKLGSIIMMMSQMTDELGKFFIAFGLVFFGFMAIGAYLTSEVNIEP
jgi:hypothetical protein